jgi:hypothetical protein
VPKYLCPILAACLFALPAAAQDAESTDTPTDQPIEEDHNKTSFSLTFNTEWIGTADFDASPGDVSVARLGARFGVRHELTKQLALRFMGSVEYSAYDFSGATGLVTGSSDPYDNITISTLSLGADYSPDETNAWFATGFVRSSGEAGADFGDTIVGGLDIGYRRQINDKLALGIAISAVSELEGDIYAIPIPIIDWQIADKWRLLTIASGALQIRYTHSDTWAFGVEGGYERREYRLDKNGPLPSGVVDERRIPIIAFATYTPNPNFVVTGRLGSHIWAEYEFENSAGNQVSNDETGAAISAGLDLTIRF